MSITFFGSDGAARGGRKAELGRSSWYLLHAAAQQVQTSDDMSHFKAFVRKFIEVYPCKPCARNAETHCKSLFLSLEHIGHDLDLYTLQQLAVSWAAQLHACVTTHLIDDKDAEISELSLTMAKRIQKARGNIRIILDVVGSG